MGLLDKLNAMINKIIFSLIVLTSFLLIPSKSDIVGSFADNAIPTDAYIEFLSDCNLDVLSLGSTTGTIKIKASKSYNGSGRVGFRVYEPMRHSYGTSRVRGYGIFQEAWSRWVLDYVLFARSSYTASVSHPNTIRTWDYNIHYKSTFGNPQPNLGARIWITGPAKLNFLEGHFKLVIGNIERTFRVTSGSPFSFWLD